MSPPHMLNVHVLPPIPGVRLVPFLSAGVEPSNRLFQNFPPHYFEGLFNRVETMTTADIVLFPHEYVNLQQHIEYLNLHLARARGAKKPFVVSAYQDDPTPIPIRDAVVLRSSAYKSELPPNDIVMPAYVEDVGAMYGTAPLPKGDEPIVGFAGKAGFDTWKDALRYAIKNYVLLYGPKRGGAYFRRLALQSLRRTSGIKSTIIVRRRYSAHRKSIEVPPEEARREFIRSIRDSHFTLAPRGDGNYSMRFYETLSMGRIPILIDTDMPLPLEDRIPYDDFIVRIPWQECGRTGEIIREFFARTSEERLIAMQCAARKAFEDHLIMPQFLRAVFSQEYLAHLQVGRGTEVVITGRTRIANGK